MSKFCVKCGAKNIDDAIFCSNCGYNFPNKSINDFQNNKTKKRIELIKRYNKNISDGELEKKLKEMENREGYKNGYQSKIQENRNLEFEGENLKNFRISKGVATGLSILVCFVLFVIFVNLDATFRNHESFTILTFLICTILPIFLAYRLYHFLSSQQSMKSQLSKSLAGFLCILGYFGLVHIFDVLIYRFGSVSPLIIIIFGLLMIILPIYFARKSYSFVLSESKEKLEKSNTIKIISGLCVILIVGLVVSNFFGYTEADDYILSDNPNGGKILVEYKGSAQEVVIPDDLNITEIRGSNVFYSAKSVKSNTVKKIGSDVFSQNSDLESVDFPNVEEIGKESFMYCEKLEKVSFPKVKTIGEKAFYNCKKLSSFLGSPNVETIGENAFAKDDGNGDSIPLSFDIEKFLGFKAVFVNESYKEPDTYEQYYDDRDYLYTSGNTQYYSQTRTKTIEGSYIKIEYFTYVKI